jgi:hypothetical protein
MKQKAESDKFLDELNGLWFNYLNIKLIKNIDHLNSFFNLNRHLNSRLNSFFPLIRYLSNFQFKVTFFFS